MTSPPAAASAPAPGRSVEEQLKSFDALPLFMKDLPADGSADDEGTASNTALEALQSLAHDGTPDEVAQNFKAQGNEYFAGKRYREAAKFYSQALDAHPEDVVLREACLGNRAACNMELQNYGQVLRDTSAVLALNAKNTKAFYRAARALFALDKLVEALDCCDHALLLEPANDAFLAMRKKVEARQAAIAKVAQEKKERERREKEGKLALDRALLARGLWVEVTPQPPDNPTPAHFDPEALPSTSRSSLPLSNTSWTPPDWVRTPLIFPLFFLYPAHAQSDFISHFHEDSTIGDHLDAMFSSSAPPVPWDEKREYVASNLVVYASTKGKRLLRVGRALSLRQLLDQGAKDADPKTGAPRDGVVLQDGILSLIVLPKGEKEKEWVERFKKDREATAKRP